MECKAFEIRDVGTFIPVIATLMLPHHSPGSEEGEAEHYLLRRSGYGFEDPLVMVCRMDAYGGAHQASYDPYCWGGATTMSIAQEYIVGHWNELKSGQVIDIEFIAGITNKPKQSERLEAFQRAGAIPPLRSGTINIPDPPPRTLHFGDSKQKQQRQKMNETNGKPELILKELRISRNASYDRNPERYTALLKYESKSSEHTLTLDESVSERVLAFIGPVIAEAAAMVARETQRNITRSLEALNNVKAIEAFAPPPAPDSPAMEAEMREALKQQPGEAF